jgi:hypothetical protein
MRPVPISVPTLKRKPYKPIPVPTIPEFPTRPPKIEEFVYTKRFMADRVTAVLNNIEQGLLSEEERRLLFWVLTENEEAIAFEDNERGTFKEKYFPDYIMETVPHEPWQLAPIWLAESIKGEVTQMLKDQMDSGNLEPSTSSYWARIFTVVKPKGGIRIVWDLQELNRVSIQDAMLPPNVTEFAESFMGHAIYSTLDLYSGYHHRTIHPDS